MPDYINTNISFNRSTLHQKLNKEAQFDDLKAIQKVVEQMPPCQRNNAQLGLVKKRSYLRSLIPGIHHTKFKLVIFHQASEASIHKRKQATKHFLSFAKETNYMFWCPHSEKAVATSYLKDNVPEHEVIETPLIFKNPFDHTPTHKEQLENFNQLKAAIENAGLDDHALQDSRLGFRKLTPKFPWHFLNKNAVRYQVVIIKNCCTPEVPINTAKDTKQQQFEEAVKTSHLFPWIPSSQAAIPAAYTKEYPSIKAHHSNNTVENTLEEMITATKNCNTPLAKMRDDGMHTFVVNEASSRKNATTTAKSYIVAHDFAHLHSSDQQRIAGTAATMLPANYPLVSDSHTITPSIEIAEPLKGMLDTEKHITTSATDTPPVNQQSLIETTLQYQLFQETTKSIADQQAKDKQLFLSRRFQHFSQETHTIDSLHTELQKPTRNLELFKETTPDIQKFRLNPPHAEQKWANSSSQEAIDTLSATPTSDSIHFELLNEAQKEQTTRYQQLVRARNDKRPQNSHHPVRTRIVKQPKPKDRIAAAKACYQPPQKRLVQDQPTMPKGHAFLAAATEGHLSYPVRQAQHQLAVERNQITHTIYDTLQSLPNISKRKRRAAIEGLQHCWKQRQILEISIQHLDTLVEQHILPIAQKMQLQESRSATNAPPNHLSRDELIAEEKAINSYCEEVVQQAKLHLNQAANTLVEPPQAASIPPISSAATTDSSHRMETSTVEVELEAGYFQRTMDEQKKRSSLTPTIQPTISADNVSIKSDLTQVSKLSGSNTSLQTSSTISLTPSLANELDLPVLSKTSTTPAVLTASSRIPSDPEESLKSASTSAQVSPASSTSTLVEQPAAIPDRTSLTSQHNTDPMQDTNTASSRRPSDSTTSLKQASTSAMPAKADSTSTLVHQHPEEANLTNSAQVSPASSTATLAEQTAANPEITTFPPPHSPSLLSDELTATLEPHPITDSNTEESALTLQHAAGSDTAELNGETDQVDQSTSSETYKEDDLNPTQHRESHKRQSTFHQRAKAAWQFLKSPATSLSVKRSKSKVKEKPILEIGMPENFRHIAHLTSDFKSDFLNPSVSATDLTSLLSKTNSTTHISENYARASEADFRHLHDNAAALAPSAPMTLKPVATSAPIQTRPTPDQIDSEEVDVYNPIYDSSELATKAKSSSASTSPTQAEKDIELPPPYLSKSMTSLHQIPVDTAEHTSANITNSAQVSPASSTSTLSHSATSTTLNLQQPEMKPESMVDEASPYEMHQSNPIPLPPRAPIHPKLIPVRSNSSLNPPNFVDRFEESVNAFKKDDAAMREEFEHVVEAETRAMRECLFTTLFDDYPVPDALQFSPDQSVILDTLATNLQKAKDDQNALSNDFEQHTKNLEDQITREKADIASKKSQLRNYRNTTIDNSSTALSSSTKQTTRLTSAIKAAQTNIDLLEARKKSLTALSKEGDYALHSMVDRLETRYKRVYWTFQTLNFVQQLTEDPPTDTTRTELFEAHKSLTHLSDTYTSKYATSSVLLDGAYSDDDMDDVFDD